MIGMTKSAALDVAAKGIRINAVCPGCVDTPMGDEIDPAAMKEFLKLQPIGRMGKPEEVAAAVLWLCTPRCHAPLHGTSQCMSSWAWEYLVLGSFCSVAQNLEWPR